MKKTFSIFAILAIATITMFTSCSSDDDNDNNGGEEPTNPTYKVHDGNIVGVWKNDDDCFISFSSDKFNSSLLNNKFIDEGDYRIDKDTIFVTNNYFGKTTKYVVNSISNNKISVTVTYYDRWDGKKEAKMYFSKTSDVPCSKHHNLVGKSFYAQYSVKGGSQHWNKVFNTYNTISCTREDVANSAPSTFYYIYLPPRIYFYIFRYGEFLENHVRYDNVTLDDNNQITHMGYLYGQEL